MKKHQHSEHEHKHSEKVEDSEIKGWKRKLVWSWILTVPIAILMMSERLFGFMILPEKFNIPAILILGFPVVFIFGWDTIRGGIRGLFTFYFNMDSLIALGTVIAYITGILSFFGFEQD